MKKILSLVFVVLLLMSSTGLAISANENSVDSEILNYRSDFLWGQNMNTNDRGCDSPPQYSEEALHLAVQQGVKMMRYQANYIDGDFTEADQIIGLCNKYGIKVMLVIFPPNVDEPTQDDLDFITQTAKTYAERYNGKDGRAKVDYFQLWNELEIKLQQAKYGGGVTPGQSIDNFYTVSVPGKDDLVEWAKNMKAAAKGIREADTDAKIVINFSWVAFGCIRYYVQEGVDFDYIGWDYYPDSFDAEVVKLNFQCALYGGKDSADRDISGVREVFPDKEVIICESNTWVKGYPSTGGYGDDDYNNTKMTLDTYKGFFEIMKLSYQQNWIKAFCAFKVADMPSHGSESERHYGHIFVEVGGKIIGPKPIYYEYQRLIGGPNNVDRRSKDSVDLKPYDKFKVKTQVDTNINQNDTVVNESINNVAVDNTFTFDNDMSTDTEPIDEALIKPNDIYKKTTQTVTHNKMPWILIISVGGGLLALFGAGFVIFLHIMRKKGK